MTDLKIKDYFSVLIPDGESHHALSVLRCLGQMSNVKTYILSNDPWVPIRFSRYATKFYTHSRKKGKEGRLESIHKIVKLHNIDIILPVDEDVIQLLSEYKGVVSDLTSIVLVPESDALKTASNKWLLAEWLKKNQLPCPPTILYQGNNNFNKAVSGITFPVLIKPISGMNGEGIKQFDIGDALRSFCNKNVGSGEFIVQSFIKGYDIDCSVLCNEGKILAHTIQKGFINGRRPYGPSSGIDILYDANVFAVVKEVVEKLNWSGIVHFDLRYDEQDKQVKVIEMNPRFWASLLGSLCAGVNFPYLTCLTVLKHDLPNIAIQPKRYVSPKIAIKIMAKRLFKRNHELYFDNSPIEFFLKDPLPKVFKVYANIYNKFIQKIKIKLVSNVMLLLNLNELLDNLSNT